MMITAYLIVCIDTKQSPPAVVRAGIYSAPPGSLTSHNRHVQYACLTEVSEKTYAEARQLLVKYVRDTPHLGWLIPFMEEEFPR